MSYTTQNRLSPRARETSKASPPASSSCRSSPWSHITRRHATVVAISADRLHSPSPGGSSACMGSILRYSNCSRSQAAYQQTHSTKYHHILEPSRIFYDLRREHAVDYGTSGKPDEGNSHFPKARQLIARQEQSMTGRDTA